MSRKPTDADEKAAERKRAEIDRRLDEELADTFPASDPPSILRDDGHRDAPETPPSHKSGHKDG
jgi:hypothetical protein